MREFIYDSWNGVMNMDINPLRHIPDTNTRHMVLQVLAWMWCIVFSMWVGSFWIMGASMIHVVFLLLSLLQLQHLKLKRKPSFLRMEQGTNGYHTPSRTRYMWYNGKKNRIDKNDVGGEHE